MRNSYRKKCTINLQTNLYWNKHIRLSKTLMQDFQYIYIKNNYGDKAKILLTDFDSLMYKMFMKTSKELLDFSNYPKDSKCYNR